MAFRNGLKQFEASGFDVVAGDRATDGIDRDCAIVLRESGGAIVAQTSAAIARAKAKQRRAVIASVGVMATVIARGPRGGPELFAREQRCDCDRGHTVRVWQRVFERANRESRRAHFSKQRRRWSSLAPR